MNGQRIALGLLVIFLFAACLLQTSMMGCAKNTTTDEAAAEEAAEDSPTFFSRSGSGGSEAPTDWRPVSENVMVQVAEMFADKGIVVANIERGQPGSSVVRCVLEPRDGLTVSKQLFDALLVLHQTYPNMSDYWVGLSEGFDETLNTNWNTLAKFVDEGGYSFETPASEAETLWARVQPGFVSDEEFGAEPSGFEDVPMPTVRSGKTGEASKTHQE